MRNTFVALLIALGLLTSPMRAFADEEVKVVVKGMVCSFCAQGLKKTFKKQAAVKDIDVDLDSKVVTIHFADGQALADSVIEQLVRDAGYDVMRIERGSKA